MLRRMDTISASVGAWSKGAVNRRQDVMTVQRLLRLAMVRQGNPAFDPKAVDGVISRQEGASDTVKAIIAFQSGFFPQPDGLIGVNGRTWRELVKAARSLSVGPDGNPNPPGEYFPFAQLPAADWTNPPRSFAANRQGGARAHAGCDLYFPEGTVIHAIGPGKVVLGPYAFYAKTFAIEVDHGGTIVRYGEVMEKTFVKAGDVVAGGQKIARVGRLVGISVPSNMLHLEMYSKQATGPLTDPNKDTCKKAPDGRPFYRRQDLMNPTATLNRLKERLPKPY